MYFFYSLLKHKIFCLKNADGEIAGIIEISLQTTDDTLYKCKTYRCSEETIEKLSLKPYITCLAVSKNYRNMGIGMRLLSACEEYARTVLKADSMYIHAYSRHIPALNLYTKYGFKEVSRKNEGGEILFMRKMITSGK
jgi:ribosomal protein S18 acetylase RimI-like enzyme